VEHDYPKYNVPSESQCSTFCSLRETGFIGSGALSLHWLVAVMGSFAMGILLEGYLGQALYGRTWIEPFAPFIALTALLMGYVLPSYMPRRRTATCLWLVGVLWLSFGIYDLMRGWRSSWSPEKTRFDYLIANLFTSRCSGTECLYELFFAVPFIASVAYSLGAYVRKRIEIVKPINDSA
jgi:hypothetical protein